MAGYRYRSTPYTPITEFNMWVNGCSHINVDKSNGRDSFLDASTHITDYSGIRSIDLAISLGDFTGHQIPTDVTTHASEGAEVASQLAANPKLDRHKIYTVTGNHDAGAGNYDWYNRYIDTYGENTAYSGVNDANRPFTITKDANKKDYYSFQAHNILFLMLNDINDGPNPCGRNGGDNGGYPAGSISINAFNWLTSMILANQDKIIIVCHHNLPKETTIATGLNDGVNGLFHGDIATGQPEGNGMLYNLIDTSDDSYTEDFTDLHTFFTNNNGCIDMWLGGHSHSQLNEVYNGRTTYETRYGINFINCSALTKYHGAGARLQNPMSRMFRFQNGANEVLMQQHLHTDETSHSSGFYPTNDEIITLRHNFQI